MPCRDFGCLKYPGGGICLQMTGQRPLLRWQERAPPQDYKVIGFITSGSITFTCGSASTNTAADCSSSGKVL